MSCNEAISLVRSRKPKGQEIGIQPKKGRNVVIGLCFSQIFSRENGVLGRERVLENGFMGEEEKTRENCAFENV